jgi:hypothetical protein
MGAIRKLTSVSSLGLVDFRSDKERTAAYTKGARKEARKQTGLLKQQTQQTAAQKPAAAAQRPATPAPPPAAPADMSAEQALHSLLGLTSSITDTAARARCRELLDEVDAIFRGNR